MRIATAASFLLTSSLAGATQPLETFLAGARSDSFDVRLQRATVEQRSWEEDAAFGRLLPGASARGVYTRNQYAAELPPSQLVPNGVTITPQDQFDAFLQLDVPIVDLASYQRFSQAKHLARASVAELELSRSDVQRAVARAYYSFIGGAALLEAAKRSVTIAEQNLAFVSTRFSMGVATELDQERARAQLEQTRQNVAEAELIGITAARNLETVSGIRPTPVADYPTDDLRGEPPLAWWLEGRNLPSDRVQAELGRAAAAAKKAAAYAAIPTLSANAQERFTNATGFTGTASTYTLQAVLAWKFDYAGYSNAQAQASAADVQQVRAERTRRNVENEIADAWERVRTGVVKSASARAQAQAALHAQELALARYQAGALTQLDVTQAQRDAFQAQASSIQADADLLYARVLLRLLANKPSITSAPAPAPAPARR